MPRRPRKQLRPKNLPIPSSAPTASQADDLDTSLARWGEWARRAALGLTAALIVARACWPGEYHDELHSGEGLGWTALVGVAALLGIFSAFFSGVWRVRATWADIGVYALFVLVPLSARQAAGGRVALNLAWEWVGVGVVYALLRSLPRGANEVRAVAGILVATAVSLSAYGLYQVGVVQPESRRVYRENPEAALAAAGVADSPQARKAFEDRLLGSKEPTATLALANSLAGVLVGALVLSLAVLVGVLAGRGGGKTEGRWVSVGLAAVPMGVLGVVLLLTKSRSAWVGLLVGLGVLGWQERRRISAKMAVGLAVGLVGLAAVLVVVGLATRQLDAQVLTQATMSLRYRWEYWVGTLGVLGEDGTWWTGLGPGNFGGPYLRHKLPQASESISDPHNLFLEVWSTAGLPALVALVAGLGLGLRAVLGPARGEVAEAPEEPEGTRVGWLVASGGLGFVLAMLLRPELGLFSQSLNPFEGDFMRWVVLIGGWVWAVLMGQAIWMRGVNLATGLGAGVVAVVVNLLAAGGIGFAPVSLGLWGMLALGLDARRDRPAGRVRELGGRGWSFGLAAVWAALAGSFVGTETPYWRAMALVAEAESERAQGQAVWRETMSRLPASVPESERRAMAVERAEAPYRRADEALKRATQADRLGARAWEERAMLEYEFWLIRGRPTAPGELAWHRIDSMLKQAATAPRDPDRTAVQAERARVAGEMLTASGWPDYETTRLRADRLDALRRLTRLDPTSAAVHAEYAEALGESGHRKEAEREAERALELDRQTPHRSRKLSKEVRARLERRVEEWTTE